MNADTIDKTTPTTEPCRCCSDGPGLERADDGHVVGRDPGKMTTAELAELGHVAQPLSKIVRLKCLDCAGTAQEVRLCTCVTCPLWSVRLGHSPFRKALAPAEKQRRADRAKRMRALKTGAEKSKGSTAKPGAGGPKAGAVESTKD
jgi:hypothetical protein